ncbi:Glycosyl transferase family 2 [compost metagenome]
MNDISPKHPTPSSVATTSDPGRRFLHPVSVIVPVYNAPDCLARLVESLKAAVPEPLPGLNFYFSDDSSPDPQVSQIAKFPFFSRPDVTWHRHPENLGFVGNVNAAIAALPPDVDVVLLNSDTEVWTEVFSVMQEEAYSDPAIASITPLTNNGTIASLFRFAEGSGMPKGLTPSAISRALQRLNIGLVDHPTPTGVGFCMYMKRTALNEIGILDATYGKGYGEECDWSRRAINRGWKHLISCKSFVLHEGTQSFDNTFKERSILTNSEILRQRYPEYDSDVAAYIARNPLKFERLAVILTALRLENSKTIYLMTLHNDPDSPNGGGTEKHVRHVQRQLDSQGHAVLELFPISDENFCLRVQSQGQAILVERFHAGVLPHLLPILEANVDCLHVHHTLHWPDEALKALTSARIPRKIFSAHDYFQICPTINLLRLPDSTSFCEVEQNRDACNSCLNRKPGFEQNSIQQYRRRTLSFLQTFDTILFPSDAMARYFELGFGDDWLSLRDRAKVLNHDLAHLLALESPTEQPPREKSLVFVGAIGIHKGSLLLLEALPMLISHGYSVEILGSIHPKSKALLGVPVTPYETPEELKQLLDERNPAIVAFPATWAETYCYAFYEGILLAANAVPVVGPFGNPANVTKQEGIGVAMRAATSEALIEACNEASESWKDLHAKKKQYLQTLHATTRPYYEAYRSVEPELTRIISADLSASRTVDLQALSKLDFLQAADHERQLLRAAHHTRAVRAALKLQAKLRAYPKVKATMLWSLQAGWKALKKLRSLARG